MHVYRPRKAASTVGRLADRRNWNAPMELIVLCSFPRAWFNQLSYGHSRRCLSIGRSFENPRTGAPRVFLQAAETRREGFLARLPRGSHRRQISPMIMCAPCRGIRRLSGRDERNALCWPDFSSLSLRFPPAPENFNCQQPRDETVVSLRVLVKALVCNSLFKYSSFTGELINLYIQSFTKVFVHLIKRLLLSSFEVTIISLQQNVLFHRDECVICLCSFTVSSSPTSWESCIDFNMYKYTNFAMNINRFYLNKNNLAIDCRKISTTDYISISESSSSNNPRRGIRKAKLRASLREHILLYYLSTTDASWVYYARYSVRESKTLKAHVTGKKVGTNFPGSPCSTKQRLSLTVRIISPSERNLSPQEDSISHHERFLH